MSILDKIIAVKKQEVQFLHEHFKLSDFEASDLFRGKVFSLTESIRAAEGIGIIAEVKKASPSKGLLREDFDPVAIASLYADNAVSGISVLTDKTFFQGDVAYLNAIARNKKCPLLRKDFIIDEYQIFEARANGADAILLISEALEKEEIARFTKTAYGLGLEVLLELHSEEQLSKIDRGLNKLIGVNNRNLNTFVTDIETTIRLRNMLPPDITIVSESGIGDPGTLERVKAEGCNAVLVGEYFIKQNDIGQAVRDLKERCSNES
jgi:indole-3-glycerol phosphate synthase